MADKKTAIMKENYVPIQLSGNSGQLPPMLTSHPNTILESLHPGDTYTQRVLVPILIEILQFNFL